MSEYLAKEILSRLKKQQCDQENCLSDNQDNLELVVFNCENAKKSGLMCSECFVDSELLKDIQPVEKYVLPIKKYLQILTSFHKEYSKMKLSEEWGPNVVNKQSEGLKRKVEAFYNDGWKFALEVSQYVESLTKKATEDLRKIYQDTDFDKIVQYLNEQNETEQERMIISNQLTKICKNIKLVEGKHRYSTEDRIKKQAEEVVLVYRSKVLKAIIALKELNEVEKECLKSILN